MKIAFNVLLPYRIWLYYDLVGGVAILKQNVG